MSVPAASADDTAAEETASVTTVVDSGDVRVTTSIEDGQLVQNLVDYTDNADGEVLDLASTVLSVPTAESWPGDNDGESDYAASWEEISPDHGDVWRTSASGLGANELELSLDSSAVGDTVWDGGWGYGGGVYTRLGSITGSGTGTGALLYAGTDLVGTSQEAGDDATWIQTGDPYEMGLYPNILSIALAFTESGTYCVTLETSAQLADDGTVLNNDVTLTFAVGDVDPATVEPCTQPEAIASQAATPVDADTDTDEVTVVDSGAAYLGSTLEDGELSLDVITEDRGRTTSYDPEQVVFSVPNQDTAWPGEGYSSSSTYYKLWEQIASAGTLLYRTTAMYGTGTGDWANDLTLDLVADFIDAADLDADNGGVAYSFKGATTSGSGYLATYRSAGSSTSITDGENGPSSWDSRSGGNRLDEWASAASADWGTPFHATAISRATGGDAQALGFAFSEVGVYCVTVENSATLSDGTAVSDTATFTFAVGVDASEVTPCEQVDGDDGGESGETDDEDLDPTVTYFETGHLDVAVAADESGNLSHIIADDSDERVALEDAVLVGRGSAATNTVEEPTETQDLTFIGEVGSTWYGWTQSGSGLQNQTIWPGISMSAKFISGDYSNRDATWTFSLVSGPEGGEAYIWSDSVVYLNSATETSTSFRLKTSHVHENWAFTEAGVYCIAVTTTTRAAGDETTDVSTTGLLTVAVGDIDLSEVQPCERTQDVPEAATADPIDTDSVSTETTVLDTDTLSSALNLVEVDGELDVVSGYRETTGSAVEYVDPDHVVYDVGTTTTQRLKLDWATLLNTDLVSDDVTLTLGEVTGGDYYFTGSGVGLDSREDSEQSTLTLWPGYLFTANHYVTSSGVTCVPLTWSGTTTDGQEFSITKTLTLVSGVDASTVTPCGEGGQATDPGEDTDDDGDDEAVVWDVENWSTTDSGALILSDGHIDIASLLSDDGALTTKVKDTTDEGVENGGDEGVSWHETDEVVLQVRPEAQTTVPTASAYSFLGEAGDTIWQVTETEQEGLLWPGWSTEAISEEDLQTGVTWTLTDASGPGDFSLYQTPFSGPDVLFNTGNGIDEEDSFVIDAGVHAHGTWSFTAEGVYCLAFTRSTTLTDGTAVSDEFTLAVAVGETDVTSVDPSACLSDDEGEPEPSPSSDPSESADPEPSPSSDPSESADPEPSPSSEPTESEDSDPAPSPSATDTDDDAGDDSGVAPVDDVEEEAGASGVGDEDGSNGEGLAATGADSLPVTLGAATLLMLVGAAGRAFARQRRSATGSKLIE